MCLEHLGGVPPILTPDNLKSAVISNDRHEPKLNKALETWATTTILWYCHVELRQDKVTHFYSVPYIHVGKQARVVFTRSWVKVYVEQKPVASHIRSHTYGYTTVREHLASSCRVIMERSAAYYVEKAKDISPDCHEYVKSVFDPKRTTPPEEVYYKLRNSIVSLRRKYDLGTFDLTCRQCMEYGIYSYGKFEAILRRNGMSTSADEKVTFHTPAPSNHENIRGKSYFTGNDMNK